MTEVPQTWEEFTAACEKIQAIGKTPFLQQWGDKSKGAMNTIFSRTYGRQADRSSMRTEQGRLLILKRA